MSRLKSLILVLGLSALPLFAAPAPAPVRVPKFHVKPGLWQKSVTSNISGELPVPDDVLARMTPAQRQSMEDELTAAKAQNAKPTVTTSCITQETINKGFQMSGTVRPNCKRTILADTATSMKLHEACTDNGSTSEITLQYHAINLETLDGTSHVEMDHQGKKLVSDGTIQAKWLSADCGDVK